MRTLATLATLLVGLAVVFWAPAAKAHCPGHAHCGDGNLGPLPVLVDSDDPPKVVGPAFPLSFGPTVMVVFTFEEQTYQLVGTPSSLRSPSGGSLFFANDTCTEPGNGRIDTW